MTSERKTHDHAQTAKEPNAELSFLDTILAHHEELELDEKQFVTLSPTYWDRSKRQSTIDAIAAVTSTLSSDQLCKVMAFMVPQVGPTPGQPTALDATVESLVTEAIEKR